MALYEKHYQQLIELAQRVPAGPDIECDDGDVRAGTEHVATTSVEFCAGVEGEAVVQTFKSLDDEDRGGFVLRLRMRDGGGVMLPHAKALPDGLELQLPGEIEATALLGAIEAAIKEALPPLGGYSGICCRKVRRH